jgi:hypothetical protein
MKLEAKHLVPYLPYGLKCQVTDLKKKTIAELHSVYANGSCTFCNTVESQKGFSNIKPILRPMSSLKFAFEHNDENIVPLLDFFEEDERQMYEFANSKVPIIFNYPYTMWCQLLEWHIDIFGLIENGIAIDINTLSANGS